jgi:hypothetical protein
MGVFRFGQSQSTAARTGSRDALAVLLAHGADVDAQDNPVALNDRQQTPLSIAELDRFCSGDAARVGRYECRATARDHAGNDRDGIARRRRAARGARPV